jgi:hypothetical protein
MCSMLDSMTTHEKSGFDTTTDFLASRLRGRRGPVGQALRMVDEFRRSAAFGAQRLAGRMRRVGFEAAKRPSSTTATQPHRVMHRAQQPWIRCVFVGSVIGSYSPSSNAGRLGAHSPANHVRLCRSLHETAVAAGKKSGAPGDGCPDVANS